MSVTAVARKLIFKMVFHHIGASQFCGLPHGVGLKAMKTVVYHAGEQVHIQYLPISLT